MDIFGVYLLGHTHTAELAARAFMSMVVPFHSRKRKTNATKESLFLLFSQLCCRFCGRLRFVFWTSTHHTTIKLNCNKWTFSSCWYFFSSLCVLIDSQTKNKNARKAKNNKEMTLDHKFLNCLFIKCSSSTFYIQHTVYRIVKLYTYGCDEIKDIEKRTTKSRPTQKSEGYMNAI